MTAAEGLSTGGAVTQVGVRLLLRPEEFGQAVGLSRAKVFQLLATGDVRSIKVGRSRRVPVAEIENWIARELELQTA